MLCFKLCQQVIQGAVHKICRLKIGKMIQSSALRLKLWLCHFKISSDNQTFRVAQIFKLELRDLHNFENSIIRFTLSGLSVGRRHKHTAASSDRKLAERFSIYSSHILYTRLHKHTVRNKWENLEHKAKTFFTSQLWYEAMLNLSMKKILGVL